MFSKDDILKEIKRTAKENGGRPLGVKAFRRATDISPFYISKHWAKFSDALEEAGFSPNKPWTRFPDELLIKKTIEKIRKYGRYPTLGELFVEFNKGDDFPFHIFKKRKQDYIIKLLISYSNENAGYEDVLEACKPIIDRLDKRNNPEDLNSTRSIGEVYLIKSGHFFKIGKTKDTVRRGTELRIQLPEKMILIHSIKTDDPAGIEAYWHKRFENKRKQGEWFDLDFSDVKAFRRWKKII